MYGEDELLDLSGIQHFSFCPRQWGLIHIEQVWNDNLLTVQGSLMHKRAHNTGLRERRGDTVIVRGLAVHSFTLGATGQCDVVEFHKDPAGHPLYGEDGRWVELPVEYKHGHSKANDVDRLQLCAQAMCLEEMLASQVAYGCLYYGATKSRERVELTMELREKVSNLLQEMHRYYKRGVVPKAKRMSACKSCSLTDLCIPRQKSVKTYMASVLGDLS